MDTRRLTKNPISLLTVIHRKILRVVAQDLEHLLHFQAPPKIPVFATDARSLRVKKQPSYPGHLTIHTNPGSILAHGSPEHLLLSTHRPQMYDSKEIVLEKNGILTATAPPLHHQITITAPPKHHHSTEKLILQHEAV